MTGYAAAPGQTRLAPSCQARPIRYQTLSVVVAVRDLLTLSEHGIFALVVGNRGRRRGLLAILGVVVGVLVVRVFILGVPARSAVHRCEASSQCPRRKTV